jgi:hypothetical protein
MNQMNWKQKTVLRILLVIAQYLAEEELKTELRNLANHINMGEK